MVAGSNDYLGKSTSVKKFGGQCIYICTCWKSKLYYANETIQEQSAPRWAV